MTISLRVAGTADAPAAVASAAPAVGAGATAPDLSVMGVVVKPYTTTITTPTGWDKVTEWTNGVVASGADVGSTKVAIFTKIGATAGATVPITTSGADTIVSQITTYARTGAAWDVSAFAVGSDAANGANYSATGNGGMGLEAGDWLFGAVGVNTDLAITGALAMTFTGATLGALNTRTSTVNATGNDSRLITVDAAVSARTTSAGPPVFTYTNTNSSSGSNIWLRLREIATPAGPVLAQTQMVKLDTASTTSLVSSLFTWNTGDLLIVKMVNASLNSPIIQTPTATGLTFSVKAAQVSASSKCDAAIYTAVAGSSGSAALTAAFIAGTTGWHAAVFERWTNATLAGTPAVSTPVTGNSIGPSATITTTAANSCVTWVSGDWSARAQGTIALRSSAVLEGTTGGDVTNYTAYFGEQDTAAAGSQTIGMTTPATAQDWTMVGIEILAVPAAAGVTFDAVAPSSAGATITASTTLSWSHTASGTNRLGIVGVAVGGTADSGTTSVTWGGAAMTSVGKVHAGAPGTDGYVELFRIIAPATGAQTITATSTISATTIIGGSQSFTGVDQTTPVGTGVTGNNTTANGSVVVASAVGNMVVDIAGNGGNNFTASGQTLRWVNNLSAADSVSMAAASSAPGAASVTMSYTHAANWWGMVAVDIKAAAAGPAIQRHSYTARRRAANW